MLTKRIIACLDVRAGRVVKGIQFPYIIDAHEGRGTLLDTVKRGGVGKG